MPTNLLGQIDVRKIKNPALRSLIIGLNCSQKTPDTAQVGSKHRYQEHHDYHDYVDGGDNYGNHRHIDEVGRRIKDLPSYSDSHHGDYCD